jgi:hypothetical protein
MPHMTGTPYAVVSCHVERPLDDDCWRRFSDVQARRPGGFSIAALLRPPDPKAGEEAELWLERAREAARRGPLGHHTHFVGPAHARPAAGDGAEHAERVRHEALWMREHGLEPRLFCGGGWYMDEHVAEVLAELGCADCTGTAFVPSYLTDGARRLSAESPAWLTLPGGQRLLELPSTHSLGMAARASTASLPAYVHVYFHDTDLLSAKRRAALRWALALLGRRCDVTDLDRLREAPNVLPQRTFALE